MRHANHTDQNGVRIQVRAFVQLSGRDKHAIRVSIQYNNSRIKDALFT